MCTWMLQESRPKKHLCIMFPACTPRARAIVLGEVTAVAERLAASLGSLAEVRASLDMPNALQRPATPCNALQCPTRTTLDLQAPFSEFLRHARESREHVCRPPRPVTGLPLFQALEHEEAQCV